MSRHIQIATSLCATFRVHILLYVTTWAVATTMAISANDIFNTLISKIETTLCNNDFTCDICHTVYLRFHILSRHSHNGTTCDVLPPVNNATTSINFDDITLTWCPFITQHVHVLRGSETSLMLNTRPCYHPAMKKSNWLTVNKLNVQKIFEFKYVSDTLPVCFGSMFMYNPDCQ